MRTFNRPIKRIVVKLGSSQIVDDKYKARNGRLGKLAQQIARLRKKGVEVVLVSSGAIALGMGELKEQKRPTELAELQARAAIGQAGLMHVYSQVFKKVGLKCAQVLLVWDDFNTRALNVRHTLEAILKEGIVPVINENDTTSTEEIKFGDNDKLSSLVAKFLHADLLVILSNVEGFYDENEQVIPEVSVISEKILKMAKGTANANLARGGMKTKIEAAQVARQAHIPTVIAGGKVNNVLLDITSGKNIGTYFTV